MVRTLCIFLSIGTLGTAPSYAQIPVTDVATTLRNAATAGTKQLVIQLQQEQHSQLRRMAHRLSNFTRLDKYALLGTPLWRIHDFEDLDAFLFARPYHAALNYGDAGSAYRLVSRVRNAPGNVLPDAPEARDALRSMMATLDLADSTLITGTDQTGRLRYAGRRELSAIAALERHVIDPSQQQSATAISDKISGAALIGARQRQSRLQLLSAILEQLLVDTKRVRDSDAVTMNMRLSTLLASQSPESSLVHGAADALRQWNQP